MKKNNTTLITIMLLGTIMMSCISGGGRANKLNSDNIIESDTVIISELNKKNIVKWQFMVPDEEEYDSRYYNNYKIFHRNGEKGWDIYLTVNEKEYYVEGIDEYGGSDMLVYKLDSDLIVLSGLVDFYESTYFVFYLKKGEVKYLGSIHSLQSENVEVEGSKQATFDLEQIDENLIIYLYLDNKLSTQYEFKLNI